MRISRYAIVLSAALGWTSLLGCQGVEKNQLIAPDVARKSSERRAEMVSHYENQRNQALFQAAKNRQQQGDDRGCREVLDQLLSRAPMHRQGRLLLAESELLAGNIDAAQSVTEPMLAKFPDDAHVQHMMGLILESKGRLPEAVPHFERAAKLAPRNESFALSYSSAKAAATDSSPAMPTPPDRSIAPRAKLATTTQTPSKSAPESAEPTPKYPPRPNDRTATVEVSSDLNDGEPAMPTLPLDGRPLTSESQAIGVASATVEVTSPEIPTLAPPTTPDHEMVAYRELDAELDELALPAMPNMPVAPTGMVASNDTLPPHVSEDELPPAERSRATAHARVKLAAAEAAEKPTPAERRMVSVVVGQMNDEPAALEAPERALEIPRPVSHEVSQPTAPNRVGPESANSPVGVTTPATYTASASGGVSLEGAVELLTTGESAKAVAEIQKLLAASPDNARLTNRAALELLRHGQTKTAQRILQSGIQRHPQSSAVHRTAGVALYRLGDYSGAEEVLRKAVSLDNFDALSYFLLGFSLEKLGRHEAASHHFAQAAELDPTLARE